MARRRAAGEFSRLVSDVSPPPPVASGTSGSGVRTRQQVAAALSRAVAPPSTPRLPPVTTPPVPGSRDSPLDITSDDDEGAMPPPSRVAVGKRKASKRTRSRRAKKQRQRDDDDAPVQRPPSATSSTGATDGFSPSVASTSAPQAPPVSSVEEPIPSTEPGDGLDLPPVDVSDAPSTSTSEDDESEDSAPRRPRHAAVAPASTQVVAGPSNAPAPAPAPTTRAGTARLQRAATILETMDNSSYDFILPPNGNYQRRDICRRDHRRWVHTVWRVDPVALELILYCEPVAGNSRCVTCATGKKLCFRVYL